MISLPHKLVLSVGLRRGFTAYRCFPLRCDPRCRYSCAAHLDAEPRSPVRFSRQAHLSACFRRRSYSWGYSSTKKLRPQEFQDTWLEQHWYRARGGPRGLGEADADYDDLPFYVRDGQALVCGLYGWGAAVRESEALDEISQELQVMWIQRW